MKQGKAKPARTEKRAVHDLTVIRKTFMEGGRWIERVKKTPIFLCECGNRYLKTRQAQRKCLTCIAHRR